ncbi:LysM peptidoglycan-binding domain-containing protein [Geosporobacter ferrireducens]|uniref:LysM peptidoglycan-binding domain-containing protein n=1 Tax=Geosporobacter ferrireducens TaxID=1424294 RepID=UPI00139B83F6|nr:LysM peptidoglycan-binding domain-containing protein [Geosporobacter ferrireducens]MTI56161.1 LysM peptidoglycan-binding domain-containing protein [Geosporobacter ferrireducens]
MYEMFFSYGGEVIRLPVNPDRLTVQINSKNKTISLIELGEVNVLKDPGLTEISFNILLPGQKYLLIEDFKTPEFYLEKFKQYKKDKKPIRWIVSRDMGSFDMNMEVSLEDYTFEERAGEEGDIYVSLKLKEYKHYETKVLSIQSIVAATTPGVNEPPKVLATEAVQRATKEPEKTYTVKSGDSLWAIAKLQLNDGSKYAEIARLNNIKNPNTIYPGQTLRLV